jgi:hypothetical protein
MSESPPVSLVALRDRRAQVIAQLSDAFARDVLDMDEFERRLALAHRAESLIELDPLVGDLDAVQPSASQALVPARSAAPERVRDKQTVVAIMGGASRKGSWLPARKMRVITIMGGAELDFRDAVFAPGVTEVHVFSVFGGAQVIVPPTLAVEMEGIAIMGGFEQADRAPVSLDPDAPLLRVTGFAMMGGVSIETRLPGESERQARKRKRRERRELRRSEGNELEGQDRPLLPKRRED